MHQTEENENLKKHNTSENNKRRTQDKDDAKDHLKKVCNHMHPYSECF